MSVRIQPEDGQSYEYVIGGAKMKCSQGTVLSPIISNDRETTFQDKNICAVTDDDPKKNNFNFGFCKAMQKPCVGCIQLLKWENYKKNAVIGEEEAFALLDKSTIKCTKGGIISFEDTGQEGDERLITGLIIYGEEAVENSKLQLTKVAYHTTYDICSDDLGLLFEEKDDDGNVISVKNQKDSNYIKTYILEDEGEYYHWLHIRHNENDASAVKPPIIPITFASNETIKLKAILSLQSKENINKEKIQIRVTQIVEMRKKDSVSYNFKVTSFKQSDKNKNEYEVEVESTNLPYKDTIRYFETFELLFEYSENGKNWYRAGTCKSTLYLTWKNIIHNNFPKSVVMKSAYTGKLLILETLLWLGCKQANKLGNTHTNNIQNEEKILDSIFEIFKTRRIIRARENTSYLTEKLMNNSLGYWRKECNAGTEEEENELKNKRSLHFLLKKGDGRCQEWCNFLTTILLCQGINSYELVYIGVALEEKNDIDSLVKDGATYDEIKKLIKKWHPNLPDSYEPPINYTFFNKESELLKDKSLSSYIPIFIMMKDCEFISGKYDFESKEFIEQSTEVNAIGNSRIKKSRAQGNDDATNVFNDHVFMRHLSTKRFYDPSYGISFKKEESNFIKYINIMVDGLLFFKPDKNGVLLYLRDNPNSPIFKGRKIDYKIVKDNIHVYIYVTKNAL